MPGKVQCWHLIDQLSLFDPGFIQDLSTSSPTSLSPRPGGVALKSPPSSTMYVLRGRGLCPAMDSREIRRGSQYLYLSTNERLNQVLSPGPW